MLGHQNCKECGKRIKKCHSGLCEDCEAELEEIEEMEEFDLAYEDDEEDGEI